MGMRNWMGWSWKGAAVLAAGVLGGGAAVAVATVPGSDGVIHACLSLTTTSGGATVPSQFDPGGSDLTVIDPSAGQQCIKPDPPAPNQTEISWNVQGPPGKPGTATYTVVPPIVRPSTPPEGRASFGTGSNAIRFGDVLSFGFGGGSSTSVGKVAHTEFQITKLVDKSSAKLFEAAAHGVHYKKVVLTVLKKSGGKQKYLVITLSDVIISADQAGSSKGGERPIESLTLNYTKVEFRYSQ